MKLNKREYAEARGVSERTVTNWIKQGLPYEGSGKKGDPLRITLGHAIQWEIEREVAKQIGSGRGGEDETTYADEELLKIRAERQLREHDAAIRALERGEKEKRLIDLEQTERVLVEAMTQLAMILRPVGRKVIPKVITARNEAEGLQIWDGEVTRALNVCADMLESIDIHAITDSEDSDVGEPSA
ncbi:terminase small subunit [Halomonas sp. OfavH-34-E]|mgnify:CR=1 FL=1|uniref:terminase small subunit n=1 Tax=Halomonas sp. OfavH-34-E TaxID=2954491 RepID=UPI0020975777|nr:terminase small subunit [Halomonas sp. OfavH-34-E]MCO7217140.1 terminase small subunit [Halomonas sp. OfavH-34-E]